MKPLFIPGYAVSRRRPVTRFSACCGRAIFPDASLKICSYCNRFCDECL